MKKILLFILALVGITQITAQEIDYVPFVREGVKWVCYYYNMGNYSYLDQNFQPGKTFFTLELKGDTTIDGHVYKAMHKYGGESINPENDTILVYLREEDRIVYGLTPNAKKYPAFEIGYGPLLTSPIYEKVYAGQEFIMYDFNDPAGYYQSICERYPGELYFEYLGSERMSINGKTPLKHHFTIWQSSWHFFFIEGIGFDGYHPGYPLRYLTAGAQDPDYYLSHVIEDGRIIYKGINYIDPVPTDGHAPIILEGRKWVNEKVIVNHGDTTRYYYTYEIHGDHVIDSRHIAKACHYYRDSQMDLDNDSIISYMCEGVYSHCYSYGNKAMEKVIEEDRNLLEVEWNTNKDGFRLYCISADNPSFTELYYYILNRKKEGSNSTLTRENFKMIEPVIVNDGERMRWAYINAEGDTMCYIVEGIGFDSRDMGDLLTPFTRRPDPGADYQEYCGLSHVIKDGKIIYKGMRFDPERVQGVPGDMNGDGEIDINDLTQLIDYLLMEPSRYNYTGDFSGDGTVDIQDVSALIDYLLTKK